MNAVEIEQAVSTLVESPFDAAAFPFAFLEAFGNKETTLKRLRTGNTNQSDVGGLLQRGNIHIKVAPPGQVAETLAALRDSPATTKHKAKFILATDGQDLHAEQLAGEVPPLACEYKDLPNHFAFFLPLAGITTVRQIAENAFDIRATGRLNRLYVELSKHNPDWDTRREDLNHFFARLIFCFFAEDTGIFREQQLFTRTVETMTERDGSNTHQVLAELFRAMNTRPEDRAKADLPTWALKFPYVNGGLFGTPSGSAPATAPQDCGADGAPYETPKFSKIARSYLLFVGGLDWKLINPDIFGSMIQAVAEDEERGALGMHYTSVPNILKVLNPLFLDDLRAKLEEAGDGKTSGSSRKLLNLRNRLARIRVFDPACGSGNFLVIAYKEMRQIEAVIHERRNEKGNPSVIPISNFRGIEIRTFAAEIARLALIIAEFQCDVLYGGEMFARGRVLPLDEDNWITCGNALRLDWPDLWDARGTGVKLNSDDLYETPLAQTEMDFESASDEAYICGNPPYQGSVNQSAEQKWDMAHIFAPVLKQYKDLDYVAAFMLKAARFNKAAAASSAFVATNSVTQGEQVGMLWPLIFQQDNCIRFAHTSFMWSNLASNKAAVTCVILGLSIAPTATRQLFDDGVMRNVPNISPYLVASDSVIVTKRTRPLSEVGVMQSGNKPTDNGNFILTESERAAIVNHSARSFNFIKRYVGSKEVINGGGRWCIWIDDEDLEAALRIAPIRERVEKVRKFRGDSRGKQANENAASPHRFVFAPHSPRPAIAVPNVSSIRRPYLPCELTSSATVVSNLASVIYDAPLWNLALVASRLHLVWIGTVCGKLKTDYRYSNTLGWNTFPVPPLTDQNKADLTRCAEDILLAREAHFPATIADLYDPDAMKEKYPDLLAAHERNDETLERIYIGKKFKNDTERLEKLFEMYTQMTAAKGAQESKSPRRPKR